MDLTEAIQVHRAGKFAGAESIYRRHLTLKPDEPQCLHLLGMLLFQTGKAEQGLELLRRSAMLEPANAGLRGNLAGVLIALGREEEAVIHAREATRLNPVSPEGFNNLGACQERRGLFEEAGRQLKITPRMIRLWSQILDSSGK